MSDRTPPTSGTDAPAAAAPAVASSATRPSKNPFLRKDYAPELNRGYGTAMNRGLELALTVVFLTAIGWGIDRVAGTSPLFIIICSVTGFVGITVKLWLGYDLEMKAHEEDAIWNRKADPS